MQVTLEIQAGASAGQVITLQPGQSVRVGRTSLADFSFPGDQHMSGVHFLLQCDDKGCFLQDLYSGNGTLVNGRRIESAWLRSGDVVMAGQTTFFVSISKEEIAVPVQVEEPRVELTPQERLVHMLRHDFQPLYAILDAAREPSVLKVLVESGAEHQSLFEGAQSAQLAHFAPYLVCLKPDSPSIETVVREGWGKSWGVFLTCELPLIEVRRHFRRFLTVKTPDRKQIYFRFYDPRVLRLFLPTCLAEEINFLFGPVKYYLMEDEKPDVLLRFSNAGRGVGRKALPLAMPKPSPEQDSSSPGVANAH
jgi:pSer/pThr/pTyr-binding forkhead associated (FHA) protein